MSSEIKEDFSVVVAGEGLHVSKTDSKKEKEVASLKFHLSAAQWSSICQLTLDPRKCGSGKSLSAGDVRKRVEQRMASEFKSTLTRSLFQKLPEHFWDGLDWARALSRGSAHFPQHSHKDNRHYYDQISRVTRERLAARPTGEEVDSVVEIVSLDFEDSSLTKCAETYTAALRLILNCAKRGYDWSPILASEMLNTYIQRHYKLTALSAHAWEHLWLTTIRSPGVVDTELFDDTLLDLVSAKIEKTDAKFPTFSKFLVASKGTRFCDYLKSKKGARTCFTFLLVSFFDPIFTRPFIDDGVDDDGKGVSVKLLAVWTCLFSLRVSPALIISHPKIGRRLFTKDNPYTELLYLCSVFAEAVRNKLKSFTDVKKAAAKIVAHTKCELKGFGLNEEMIDSLKRMETQRQCCALAFCRLHGIAVPVSITGLQTMTAGRFYYSRWGNERRAPYDLDCGCPMGRGSHDTKMFFKDTNIHNNVLPKSGATVLTVRCLKCDNAESVAPARVRVKLPTSIDSKHSKYYVRIVRSMDGPFLGNAKLVLAPLFQTGCSQQSLLRKAMNHSGNWQSYLCIPCIRELADCTLFASSKEELSFFLEVWRALNSAHILLNFEKHWQKSVGTHVPDIFMKLKAFGTEFAVTIAVDNPRRHNAARDFVLAASSEYLHRPANVMYLIIDSDVRKAGEHMSHAKWCEWIGGLFMCNMNEFILTTRYKRQVWLLHWYWEAPDRFQRLFPGWDQSPHTLEGFTKMSGLCVNTTRLNLFYASDKSVLYTIPSADELTAKLVAFKKYFDYKEDECLFCVDEDDEPCFVRLKQMAKHRAVDHFFLRATALLNQTRVVEVTRNVLEKYQKDLCPSLRLPLMHCTDSEFESLLGRSKFSKDQRRQYQDFVKSVKGNRESVYTWLRDELNPLAYL